MKYKFIIFSPWSLKSPVNAEGALASPTKSQRQRGGVWRPWWWQYGRSLEFGVSECVGKA